MSSQSTTGFTLSANISKGDLVSGEYNPRIVESLLAAKFQVDYSIVNWKYTKLRLGVGYQFIKGRNSSVDYLIFPIVFQRYIDSKKKGFNTSLVLYPSLTMKDQPILFNTNIINFNLQLAVRAGTTVISANHKITLEVEFATPISSISNHGTLKYITYGLRIGYRI